MIAMAVIVFAALTAIAAMHVAWAFGACWPAEDERQLVAIVVGRTGQTRMPARAQTLAAAAAIFAAGIVAAAAAGLIQIAAPPILVTVATALCAIVFTARGIAAFLPAWRRRFSQEPFVLLDRSWYAPLCLLFAVVFTLLAVQRFVAP